MALSLPVRSKRLGFGLVTRRERWGLSWLGWVVLLATLGGMVTFSFFRLYTFLAVTEPLDTDILVVEGWIPDFAINSAAQEFAKGKYTRVFTTGGPITGTGGYTNDYNTSASLGATRLRTSGVAERVIQMVPSRVMKRDRTYGSASALRVWFDEHRLQPVAINVLTEAVHARRTRLAFQKAFGGRLKVGIIPIQNPDYPPERWWKYSEGVKDVLTESIAYAYAKLIVRSSED